MAKKKRQKKVAPPSSLIGEQQRALIIDGNNYLFRAFHSVPMLTNRDGFPTNAIRGFFNILTTDIKILRPDYLIVVFDVTGGTQWRIDLLPEYKSSRKDRGTDEGYIACMNQMTPIRRILKALGVKVISKRDCEADDVIGTLALKFAAKDILAMMSTNDKDVCQVVSDMVVRVEAKTRALLGRKETIKRFGVPPEKIIEYLMLMGDNSDDVPGVYKCGEKTAAKLLNEYGSIKRVVANAHRLTPALHKNVKAAAKRFKITRQVLTIDTQIKLKSRISEARFRVREPNIALFDEMCSELELRSTRKEIASVLL